MDLTGVELLVLDFDNTMAETLQSGPEGQSVPSAYESAVCEALGSIAATIFKQTVGGHIGGMSPGQIVEEVLKQHPSRSLCLTMARSKFLAESTLTLYQYVPPGKGTRLVWADADPLRCIAEWVIRLKIKYLLSIVTPDWPPLTSGFKDFMERVGPVLPWGIVSAGHDAVIGEVLKFHGLQPYAMITDDDTRGWLIESDQRVKPHPQLMSALLEQMSRRCPVPADRQRIIYVGDSVPTDSLFAQNSGVRFAWFNPGGNALPDGCQLPPDSVVFSDWAELNLPA